MPEVIGVLIAAGAGTRFDDGHKLLAPFEGSPIVTHAARTLAAAELDHRVGIVGHERGPVTAAIEEFVEEVRFNPRYVEGMSRSVALGARHAADRDADAAVLLPGDMPCVAPETIDRLRATLPEHSDEILLPEFDSLWGNPALIPARYFEDLADLEGDVGGRALFDDRPIGHVVVSDPGIHRDIDTREDLERLRQSGCGDTRS